MAAFGRSPNAAIFVCEYNIPMIGNVPIKWDTIIASIVSVTAVVITVWKDIRVRRDTREQEEKRLREDNTRREYDERQTHVLAIAEMVRLSYEHLSAGQISNNENLLKQLEWYVEETTRQKHENDVLKIAISACTCGSSKRLLEMTISQGVTHGSTEH